MDTEIKILDLGEAAALKALGFELLRLEPTHRPRQRAFVFPSYLDVPTGNRIIALDVAKSYATRALQIEAREFYECIRSLKSRLHDDLEDDRPPRT